MTEKVVDMQQELGSNTMTIIITSMVVTFTNSLLLFSLSKRGETPKQWISVFQVLLLLTTALPLINFYHFLRLASRVVRTPGAPCAMRACSVTQQLAYYRCESNSHTATTTSPTCAM